MTQTAALTQWWGEMMSLESVIKLLEVIGTAVVGILAWLTRQYYRQGVRDEQFREVQRKLAILMIGLYRRGGVELALKGEDWALIGSPLHLGQYSVKAVMPFLDVFLPFYADLKVTRPEITDEELFWAIEEKFGDFIVEKICIPNQLQALGCLTLVLEFCKLQRGDHAGRVD